MAGDSPAVILFDINGNQIGVVYDGAVYRLETDARITDGIDTVGISTVAGEKALKVDVVRTVGSGSVGVGGTSSTYDAEFPTAGTAAGYSDGYFMRGARVYDLDLSSGSEHVLGVNLRSFFSGGSIEVGNVTNPLFSDITDRSDRDLGVTDRSTTAIRASVAASATDVTVLVTNTNRRDAFFYNNSDSPVHIGLGTVATSLSDSTVVVGAHLGWELPFHFTGEVHAIWEVATGDLRITELT